MNRLMHIINALNYKELKAIEKDLYEGNIGQLIKERINEIEKKTNTDGKVCPTCGNRTTASSYTLYFGPSDFRKKASFCGLDCLTFFIEKLRNNKTQILD